MLNFREHKDLIEYEASDVSPLDEANVEQSLVEARRNVAPAVAAAAIYMQSTKIKSATQKIRAADTVEEKLDALSEALDFMNSKSTAISALIYFLTKQSKSKKR
jgi:mannose-1-phosphate guanylyltransferase